MQRDCNRAVQYVRSGVAAEDRGSSPAAAPSVRRCLCEAMDGCGCSSDDDGRKEGPPRPGSGPRPRSPTPDPLLTPCSISLDPGPPPPPTGKFKLFVTNV